MGVLDDFNEIMAKAKMSINDALAGPMADGLQEKVQAKAMEQVYSYNPDFYSRREADGGLIDKANMPTTVSDMVLTLENTTGLQNLFGGNDSSPLTPIVEEGVGAYHMPYPRPFMEEAEEEYASGEGEAEIKRALAAAGLTVL